MRKIPPTRAGASTGARVAFTHLWSNARARTVADEVEAVGGRALPLEAERITWPRVALLGLPVLSIIGLKRLDR